MLRAASSQNLFLGTFTFATLPAVSASNSGMVARVTDVGTNSAGSLWISNGTVRWTPVGGALTLAHLGTSTGNITNSETVVVSRSIPAGVILDGDLIRIGFHSTKSGTTDSLNCVVRVGTAGTTADTAVWTGTTVVGAASTSGSMLVDLKRFSATTVGKVGPPATGFSNTAAGAQPAAATITSWDTTAQFITLTFASSGATNTVTCSGAMIQLIT